MKKHYYVIKTIICDLSGQGCGDSCLYNLPVFKPDCENCDIYQEHIESKGVETKP